MVTFDPASLTARLAELEDARAGEARAHDLVVASHGRGMWILDALTGLESASAATLTQPAALLAVRPAAPAGRVNRGRDSQGAQYFAAPNPPDGAAIDYVIGDAGGAAPTIDILDASGRVIRTLTLPAGRTGFQRAIWDLRAAPTAAS
mgnify:CR=1 FL=1